MQIGDRYTFTPTAFRDEVDDSIPGKRPRRGKTLTGRIVYIHPKHRFFTVEAVVQGHNIRESFYFEKQPDRRARQ